MRKNKKMVLVILFAAAFFCFAAGLERDSVCDEDFIRAEVASAVIKHTEAVLTQLSEVKDANKKLSSEIDSLKFHELNTVTKFEKEITALKDIGRRQNLKLTQLQTRMKEKDKQIATFVEMMQGKENLVESIKSEMLKWKETLWVQLTDGGETVRNKVLNQDTDMHDSPDVKVIDENRITLGKESLREHGDGLNKPLNNIDRRQILNGHGSKQVVAFSAYLGHLIRPISYGQTIVCDKVLINEGHYYNGATGIFTVPVNGVYLLTFHINSWISGSKVYVKMVKDGNTIVGAVADPEGTNHDVMGGNTVIYSLNEDDKVWLTVHGTAYGELQSNDVHRYVTFSGVLLF